MQTGVTSGDCAAEAGLGAALAAWARAPGLASTLRDPERAYLVLDALDGRILYASPAAGPLAADLRGLDRVGLARQIAGTADAGAPRLARLRLDPRRIAPPALCLVAGGAHDGGGPVVLLVPTGPLPRPGRATGSTQPPLTPPRQPSERAADGPVAPVRAADPPADTPPRVGDRFLWRSDRAGTLTALTGAGGALARLVGRDWPGLAASGALAGAEPVLEALSLRHTFRALPVALDLGQGAIEIDLSGAPLGRGEVAFSGFGLIRRVPAPPEAAFPDPVVDGRAGGSDAPGAADSALSAAEHTAFREIARALGARYAGDDEPGPAGGGPAMRSGAVMPFPGPQAERIGAPAAAAVKPDDLLAGLPVPALIHRGDAILAANRPMLDLLGFDGLDALTEAGMGRLFRGLAPDAPAPGPATLDGRQTLVETAHGRARPVEASSGPCTWGGAPAACLILRRVGEDDPVRALAAERLARQAQATRALGVEAALDALDDGVLTLDGAGRVVAMNRAAVALFRGEPREVIGGDFAGLLDPDAADAVARALRGAGEPPRRVSVRGRGAVLALAPARADGHRVVVLRAGPGDRARAEPGPEGAGPSGDGAALLGRLEHEVRAPMTGIVELTGAMLREPFGPLGDARYRACLAELNASAERALARAGELLDLAAVEAGAVDLDPRPLALNEIVAGCVARLQPEAARGRIVMRTSFSADLADPEADERSVVRAACLVIEHAIRGSVAGGQVIVSTGPAEGAGVALRVRGSGTDRSEAAGDRVLALPRALVEANGGRLRLSHRAEEGTLVEISLPIRRADPA